ncbi:hypothetical protein DFA_12138 [Cavenderia fasciculata]|uniref:Uncharacterized protein n=1 Tax=Cavenderia fasciculata TaxID=261658 RepID=F4QC85_CACFS|nr:uncharacterized protein DFA_12138 [Cavenderia fasciculata]EGG14366.1 hypothetical protein DFA_12138 [Cavenderia fasciculata]|eukprot:XP_004351090.1 hypothetical protein DFA_12138 [Cavenderia fasciculata]
MTTKEIKKKEKSKKEQEGEEEEEEEEIKFSDEEDSSDEEYQRKKLKLEEQIKELDQDRRKKKKPIRPSRPHYSEGKGVLFHLIRYLCILAVFLVFHYFIFGGFNNIPEWLYFWKSESEAASEDWSKYMGIGDNRKHVIEQIKMRCPKDADCSDIINKFSK